MCGILGAITSGKCVNEGLFQTALLTLNHRGPDGRGVYHHHGISLGHTRLSIVDLSSNGAQPMHFYTSNKIALASIEFNSHNNGGGGG